MQYKKKIVSTPVKCRCSRPPTQTNSPAWVDSNFMHAYLEFRFR